MEVENAHIQEKSAHENAHERRAKIIMTTNVTSGIEQMSEQEILEIIAFYDYVKDHPEEFQDIEIKHF